jgi:hypothetical protein
MIGLLKIVSLVITGALGVYGTVHDYKKEGKLTRQGWVAVFALTLCAMTALILQLLEFKEGAATARKANEQLTNNIRRQEAILTRTEAANDALGKMSVEVDYGLRRLSSPLKEIYFSYRIDFDGADTRFSNYWNRIASIHTNQTSHQPITQLVRRNDTMEVVGAETGLFPRENEGPASEVLNEARNLIAFFSESMDSSPVLEYRTHAWNWDKEPLIRDGNLKTAPNGPRLSLHFDFKNKLLTQEIRYASVSQKRNSQQIASILDLTHPREPKKLFFQIGVSSRYQKTPPKIRDVTIHFYESFYNSIDIPGEVLQVRKLDDQYFGYYCSFADIKRSH